MNVLKNILASLRKVGEALMLPVSVLPAAGILLGLGSAEVSWLPVGVSTMMKISGEAIFNIMPLIFAVGVALGFTSNKSTSALSAVVGYFVFLASLGGSTAFFAHASIQKLVELKKLTEIMGVPTVNTGVFGGVFIGGIAAWLFNRYNEIKLPNFLAFFGGERFIPIMTVVAAVVLGLLLSIIWPPIGNMIQAFSKWAAYENPTIAFSILFNWRQQARAKGLLLPDGDADPRR